MCVQCVSVCEGPGGHVLGGAGLSVVHFPPHSSCSLSTLPDPVPPDLIFRCSFLPLGKA